MKKLKKIPKIFNDLDYQHISEREKDEMYNNKYKSSNFKMYNFEFEFDEKTYEITNIKYQEYGKYLRRKKLEKIEKIIKENES